MISDSSNTEVWRWESDPFGVAETDEDPDGDGVLFAFNLRFPGQYSDRETGHTYNINRDYNPNVGRYIESDPIGIPGGINTYTYVNSNPAIKMDLLGLIEWDGMVSGGAILTAGLFTFELESECVDGKRGVVTVTLAGPGGGLGLFDFSLSASGVKLNDPLDFVDTMIFDDSSLDGGFIASAGVSFGVTPGQDLGRQIGGAPPNSPTGVGCAAIRLGNAGGTGCGGLYGLEAGIGMFSGSSTVISSTIEDCECKSSHE